MLEVDLKWTIEWNSCSHTRCFPLVKLRVASYLFCFQFVTSSSLLRRITAMLWYVAWTSIFRQSSRRLSAANTSRKLTWFAFFSVISNSHKIRSTLRWKPDYSLSSSCPFFFLLVFTALFSINVIPFPTFGYIVQPLFFSSLPLSRSRPLSWHREQQQQQQSLGSDSQGQFIKKVCRKLPFFFFF